MAPKGYPASPALLRKMKSTTFVGARRPPSSAQASSTSSSPRLRSYSSLAFSSSGSPQVCKPRTNSSVSGVEEAINTKVHVAIRIRPEDANSEPVFDAFPANATIYGKDGAEYTFDHVYTGDILTKTIFENNISNIVLGVMDGYHGTVFAYGQTGTGKTHSMQGTRTEPGLIPLAAHQIFRYIKSRPDVEYTLRISYLELYNEKLKDLLSPGSVEPMIRTDSRRGTYAHPVREEIITSPEQLLVLIRTGDQARQVADTDFNLRSSRSHAILQVFVEARQINRGTRTSTLNLIDLAGSEKAASEKERRQEGAYINKSLLTLGTVIAKLTTPGNSMHVPFRDSKLTRLLQPALVGSALISIIGTVKLSKENSMETVSTLKFASRARNLVTHAKRGEENADPIILLSRYAEEIADLKQRLKLAKGRQGEADDDVPDLPETTSLHRSTAASLKEKMNVLTKIILSSEPQIHKTIRNFSAPVQPLAQEHDDSIPELVALREEIAQKTRIITDLEKRLIHDRRSSIRPLNEMERHLREKEQEILELKATIEDKNQIIRALQSAAKKREMAEFCAAEKVFQTRSANRPTIEPLRVKQKHLISVLEDESETF